MSDTDLNRADLTNPPARRSATRVRLALVAVVLVPLAVAGLVVGATAGANDRLEDIPALVVNSDELVTQTAADGTKTQILAGRQLVTELTGKGTNGFDWQVSNAKDAAQKLKDGDVYAVLTVPKDFSKSIVSLQGDDPVAASFSIRTDEAHGYLGPAVASVVTTTLEQQLGQQVTQTYIAALFSGYASVGSSLSDAADGAQKLADGTDDLADGLSQLGDGATQAAEGTDALADGLGQLSDGASSAATGASTYARGVREYTGGVDQVSDGLDQIASKTQNLGQLSTGISDYTTGVSQLAAGLDQLNENVQAGAAVDPGFAAIADNRQDITDGLNSAADGGTTLAEQTSGLGDLSTGIAGAASGLRQISAGSSQLDSGASQLASGVSGIAEGAAASQAGADKLATGSHSIADGVTQSQAGAEKLASGTHDLADGLRSGADQVPSVSDKEATARAKVIAAPVTHTSTIAHEVTDIGQGLSALLIPLGLWIGSIATFLVLAPLSRRLLASSASGWRLVFATSARAGVVALAQAAVLDAFLFAVLRVPVERLPLTVGFSIVMALAFTAFHHLLTTALGRAGLVISLILLAVQITSTGGLYPIGLVSEPFQAVSPFLPLTYAVDGMQAIITGGGVTPAITGALVLAVVGIVSHFITRAVVRRRRRASAVGLVPAASVG